MRDFLSVILGTMWIGTWFAAIWVNGYEIRLFITGLFCLIISAALAEEN